MSEPTDNPAVTDDEQPADQPDLGSGDFNGSLMAELRNDVEARLRPLLDPPAPEPDPRLADLSENDRDILAEREQQYSAELEQLAFENELLSLSREYPNEVAIVQKMLAGESIADYVAALHEALNAGREAEQDVAAVDRNNPPNTPIGVHDMRDMIRLPDGRLITREAGLEILRDAGSLHG